MAKRVSYKLYEHEIVLAEEFCRALNIDLDVVAKKALMMAIYTAYEEGKRNVQAASGIPEGADAPSAQSESSDSTALADSEKSGDTSEGSH